MQHLYFINKWSNSNRNCDLIVGLWPLMWLKMQLFCLRKASSRFLGLNLHFDLKHTFADERIFSCCHKCESRVSSAFPPRMQTCFYRRDCLRTSALLRSQDPLQLSEAFDRHHWMHLFSWTLTSVKWWQFRLRQHLRERGRNRGRGSPIKCLAGFTLNQYKKENSQLRHLAVRFLLQ